MRHLQAEEVLNLHGPDGDTNPRGEAQRHRQRNILNQAAKAGQAKEDQEYTGHQGRDQQARQAKLLRNGVENNHEGRRRPGDAKARAAGQGDNNPRDGRGVQAVLRCHAAADRQRHRQRNSDNPDGDTGNQIAHKSRGGVFLFPAGINQRAERHNVRGE